MNYTIEFESLLSKQASDVKEIIGTDFKFKDYGKKLYFSNKQINRYYHNMSYDFIAIVPDKKDAVQSIIIYFNEIISRQSYDSLILKYGKPKSIQVIKNKKLVSETILKENNIITEKLSKTTFDLREGRLDENPLFIIWERESFQIRVFLQYEKNKSEITFTAL